MVVTINSVTFMGKNFQDNQNSIMCKEYTSHYRKLDTKTVRITSKCQRSLEEKDRMNHNFSKLQRL